MESSPQIRNSRPPRASQRSMSGPITTASMAKAMAEGEATIKHRKTSSSESLAWKDMFDGVAHLSPENHQKFFSRDIKSTDPAEKKVPPKENEAEGENSYEPSQITRNPELRLALYIALAHGGLILSLAAVYGVGKLLEEYWTPIQWAILCSMPLREIQGSLVEFWTQPLKLGLLETILALPVAVIQAMVGTFNDLKAAICRVVRKSKKYKVQSSEENKNKNQQVGFSKLLRWLVSFGLFMLTYERLGASAWAIFSFAGCILYAAGRTVHLQDPSPGSKKHVASTLAAISMARRRRADDDSQLPIWSRASRGLTQCVLKRLHTLIALGLITMMIVGSMAGIMFFSYKIGMESRDAVMSIKVHVQKSNYAERVGLKQWINDNNIPELMDTYTVKFYDTISQQVDSIAQQYNMTELVQSFKHFVIKSKPNETSTTSELAIPPHPITQKLQNIRVKAHNRDFRAIYTEVEGIFSDLALSPEVLMEKAKGFALQSLDVVKRVYASGTMVMTGSTNLVLSIGVSIASGAAGVFNFFSQSMVFFWLLYYLITSESGGVMDHVLDMLPVSKTTRSRCAKVLDHAVSSVLLATAKIAIFQAAVTWLFFRFFQIHFVYMSTVLAFTSALLPILPFWVSSLPAAVQLAVEGRYVQSVVLTIIHLCIMDYGVTAIQYDVPGQNAYLTGLSIIGGMALFSSTLEGALMGPLILTFMMALKNLYGEFVLASLKEMK